MIFAQKYISLVQDGEIENSQALEPGKSEIRSCPAVSLFPHFSLLVFSKIRIVTSTIEDSPED